MEAVVRRIWMFIVALLATLTPPVANSAPPLPGSPPVNLVALPSAVNAGGATKKEPKYDKALYTANKSSDRDKDGIACEK